MDKYVIIVLDEQELIVHGERSKIPQADMENEDALHFDYATQEEYEAAVEEKRNLYPAYEVEEY